MKFLIVGCGSIGQRHLKNLKELSAGELLAFDTNEDRMREAESKHGARTFPSFEEALAQRPDAILVCTPTSRHLDYALAALHHNCHLFVEKPISHSMDGLDELIRAASSRNRIVLVGCNFRFESGIKQTRQLIEEGKVGKVLFAQAEFGQYLPDWHPWEDYRHGYSAQKALGGGIIFDSIHELDYLYWFFGKVKETYCVADKLSRLEIDVEDTAEIILRFASGILARVHLDYIQRDYHRSLKIVGEDGMVTWNFGDNSLRWYSTTDTMWHNLAKEAPPDTNEMYVAEMKHFIRCIKGEEYPLVDAAEGKEVLEIVLAAKKSAEIKMPVGLSGRRRQKI